MKGYVYFAQADSGHIKIGYSKAPLRRMKELRNEYHRPHKGLKLLASVPTNAWSERVLHREFRRHNFKGEWFRPVPELLRVVRHAAKFQRFPRVLNTKTIILGPF